MNSELNLKGHVEIYDQSGNKILDEHNMITNIGKQMILNNIFQANTYTMIKYITFGYGKSASIVPNITLADLAKSTNTTDKDIGEASNNLKNALYRLVTRAYGTEPPRGNSNTEAFSYGIIYGDIYTASKSTNDFNIINGDGTTVGKFTDDGNTVTYTDSDGNNDPIVTGGAYIDTDTSSSKAIVYAKITNSHANAQTPPLLVIGLSGEAYVNPSTGNIRPLGPNGAVPTDGTLTVYPFTALSFNIGQLAANATYVIKYTLYM